METLLEKEVHRSTRYYRENSNKIKVRVKARFQTLNGKLCDLANNAKFRAKQKDMAYEIDRYFLHELYLAQDGMCALSGLEMEIRGEQGGYQSPNSMSLDRIDSTKGYTKDNVQLVCTAINLMKMRLTDADFMKFCIAVTDKNRPKPAV